MNVYTRITLILFMAPLVVGQSKTSSKHVPAATSPSASTLIAINVKGTRYKPADVIAVSGLRLGQNVTEQSFKAASAKLGGSGLFTDIAYSYSYSSAGMKLDLDLVDNAELVPVRFENFVWYSDQELIEKLHAQLGLFDGKLPLGGSLNDEVAELLSGMIATHNPRLHATYLRSAPSPDSAKVDSVVFSASGVPIQIRKVVYSGNNPELAAPLADVAKKMEGQEYLRSKLRYFASMDARSVYLRQGYLKADFGVPEPTVVSEEQEKVIVDVKLPVTEGLQYKLSSIEWAGDNSFPPDKLQRMVHLIPERPVNAVQLDEDLNSVRKLYGTRGYLNAKTMPETDFNDSQGSVAYKLVIKTGDQYHFGEVDFDGLDEKSKARLREDWHLREGEPYDSSYPARFVRESSGDLPTGVHWKITPHESINEDEKTVDVTMTYAPAES
jgi:outer membrane protein assembly factor BamA